MKLELRFIKIVSFIFLTLIIAFLISTWIIGGDAMSGKVENNRYYVWDAIHKSNNRGEKLYLEVSKSVYFCSLILSYLSFFTMPIFIFFKIKEYQLNKKYKTLKI